MKKYVILLVLCFGAFGARAQHAEDSVKAVINELFSAMKSRDTTRLRACFSDSAILQTIQVNRKGEARVSTDAVGNFVRSVATAPPGVLDERITFDVVKTDAGLAIAWTPYSFYFGDRFSHCGVNSFQLVRIAGQWKIQYLIDTRRRVGCNEGAGK